MHRHGAPEDACVRPFTIDEAEPGPCDDAIGGIAAALARIERFPHDASRADGHQP